jgi:hypothetical protein
MTLRSRHSVLFADLIVQFDAFTDVFPIEFGQAYTQPKNLTNGFIGGGGPENGFEFINQASAAAAVVYKKVEGSWSPVYVSQDAPLPPGTETLIPIVSAAIWFANNAL